MIARLVEALRVHQSHAVSGACRIFPWEGLTDIACVGGRALPDRRAKLTVVCSEAGNAAMVLSLERVPRLCYLPAALPQPYV